MDVSISRERGPLAIGLGASMILNVVLAGVIVWPESEGADAPDPAAPIATKRPLVIAETVPTESTPVVAPEPAVVEAPKAETADTASKESAPGGVRVSIASVVNSIPQTMAEAAAPYGDFVSATLSRLLVWDLDLRRDLRAGDKIEVAWSLGTSDTVVIEGARYHAQKHNKTIEAYRFQAKGDKYPSYWSADGTEIPHRLQKSPLGEYEQITSLLKDRPTHHGMDFKVAVGTPVMTAFDGVVTRANWNWKANGNCVEVRHADGVLAKYLHLSENKVKAGTRVRAGDVIGLSGNTGRSTGPHLHYQLNKGAKVIDPIDYHGTDRRKLPESDRAAFDEVVKAAQAKLDAANI